MKAIAKLIEVDEVDLGYSMINSPNYKSGNTKFGGIVFYDKNGKGKRVRPRKLFAVTQDIKVGDEIISDINGRKFIFKKGDIIKDICFKILGELSPQATFVKDGDEIEGRLYPQFKGDKKFVWSGSARNLEAIANMEEVEKMIFVVKCPTCNIYH